MKKGLRYAIISVLAVLISVMVSCDNGGTGGGIDNTPAVVNATKAFQIYGTNESYDTLKEAVDSLKSKKEARMLLLGQLNSHKTSLITELLFQEYQKAL